MAFDDWLAGLGTVRGWLASVLVGGCLAGIWIFYSAAPPASTTAGQIPSPRQGFLAPAFELDSQQGDPVRLEDLRGQVVVINFWASWCPPCQAEMPALERLYQAEKDQGLVVLGVNATFEDDPAEAAAFAAQKSLSFPVALDRSGEVNHQYQIRALPTTFVVDRRGVIRQVIIGGPLAESSLRSVVQTLLGEAP
jgi:cytochrome c biogenesis protein CcmG, thiol:disulfide interchange protein DsbE